MRNKFTYFLILFFSGCVATTGAQQQSNPFEMEYRMEKSGIENTKPEEVTGLTTGNPFDISRTSGKKTATRRKVISQKKKQVLSPEKIDQGFYNKFKFWLLLGIFFVLGALVSVFRNTVKGIYRAFYNENYLKLLHRNNAKGALFPYAMLYILFFLTMGTFIFLLINHYLANAYFGFKTFSACVIAVSVLYTLKHIVLYLIGRIFPVGKEMGQYGFTIMTFSTLLGIFLVPVDAILMNSSPPVASFVIYFTGIVILMVLLFRVLRSLFLAGKYISFHKFHFFMYICTVEIAPVLILLKLILLNTGVQ